MEINSITFNGINSLTYGLYVSGNNTFNSPEKDYEKVSVPGRSGDLLIFNNRFKNITVQYPAILFDNYSDNTELVRAWLLSSNGYCRLEDTYHPDEYRRACFTGPVDFDTILLEAGETVLNFDCMPQRWLKSGETLITMKSNGYMVNPTKFNAKPIIRIYGKGTIDVGTGTITVTTPGTNFIDIDCDIHDCYETTYDQYGKPILSNRNSNVEISKWPELTPGRNYVKFVQGDFCVSKLSITPRWWTL